MRGHIFSKRILRAFALAILVLINHAAGAQADPISFQTLLDRKAPVPTERIAYGEDVNQFGELWLPDAPGPYPLVIMIHGGCWQSMLPGTILMSYIAEDLRKNGFAVWNLEYRRLGDHGGGYPGTFLDIADGIDALRKIGPAHKLDLSNIRIIGHSAGGHLALWAAARKNISASSRLYRRDPLPVHQVLSLAGVGDLEAYRNGGSSACGGPSIIDRLISANDRPGQDPYADTSPVALLPLRTRQVIISGNLDPIVPNRFGAEYGTLAQARGDPIKIVEIAGAGHFELIDPASPAWRQIKDYLKDDISRAP